MNKTLLKQAQELARIWGGFRASRVVLTANNYGLFEHLKSPKTADEVAGILGTDRRATEILMDAAASLGLLEKTGAGYRNAPIVKQFLLKDSPFYQGDMLRHADSLWKSWSGLDEVLKTGRPNRAGGRDHEIFIRAMHNNAVLRAPAVVKAIDLRGVNRVLDLGGGPGTYSMEFAKKGLRVTLFDIPSAIEIAEKIILRAKLKNIDFNRGDFHVDDIGHGYDLIFISQVFHAYPAEENIGLLNKSRDALNPKGKIAIQEFYLDKNRAFPVPGALFSVNMLVNTASGRCYAPQEMKKWLVQTGFRNVKETRINDTVLLTGTKGR